MTKPDKHLFEVGVISGGRIAAISTSNPYFCFVAASAEEAEQKAKRALDFYFEASGHIISGGKAVTSAQTQRSGFRSLETCEG